LCFALHNLPNSNNLNLSISPSTDHNPILLIHASVGDRLSNPRTNRANIYVYPFS